MKLSVAASCLLSLPTATFASTKATKANASSHKANASPNKNVNSQYFLGPVSCPGHCASGANFGGILAAENVQQCNPEDKDQRWLVHQEHDDGEIIKIESPVIAGRCLGVAHGGGDMLDWPPFGKVKDPTEGTELDHGVSAVGYGTEAGQEYLIVNNSWGTKNLLPVTLGNIVGTSDEQLTEAGLADRIVKNLGQCGSCWAFSTTGGEVNSPDTDLILFTVEEAETDDLSAITVTFDGDDRTVRLVPNEGDKVEPGDAILAKSGEDRLLYLLQLGQDGEVRLAPAAINQAVAEELYEDALAGSAPSANEETCNGQLALVDCQDPTANWLFSGAQLFSAACWIAGHSAAMAVNEDCTSLELSLAANGVPNPITRAQSFMLFEPSFIGGWIPDGPSDIRLKHNVHLIGESPTHIPIYSFQYRDGIKLADNKELDTKNTFVGVMAQDLLELAPYAVTKNEEDGYYRVDYSQIDVDFGKL